MPTTVYSVDEVSTLLDKLQEQINVLGERVDILEGDEPPIDPPFVESPNGTEVIVGGTIVHGGVEWTIGLDRRIYVSEVPDTTTSNVVRLVKEDPHIFQQNIEQLWWRKKVPQDVWLSSIPPVGWIPPVVPPTPTDVIQSNKGSLKPTVVSGANAIRADLTKTTGALWCKAVSGCAAQGLDNIHWKGEYNMLLEPQFQAACADFDFRFVRINGLGAVKDCFGPNANSTTPDWRWIDNIIKGFDKTFPAAQFCMSFAGNGDFDFNNATLRNNIAQSIKAIIERMRAGGLKIDFIGGINEPDAGTPTPKWQPSTVGAMIAQMRVVMPTEVLAGPFTSYGRGDFGMSAAQTGAKMITWHYYNHPNQANRPTNDKIWTDAAAFNGIVNNMRVAAINGGVPDPIMCVTEYGLDYTPGTNNDPRQQTWEGAIFTSLLLMSGVYGGLSGGTIWRAENFDGTYGVFKTGTLTKNPNGALLQALTKYVGGAVVPLELVASGGQRLLGICTITPSDFALVVTNYGSTPWTGPIELNGRSTNSQVTRFDLNATHPLGLTGVSALTGVTIPQNNITILSGAR